MFADEINNDNGFSLIEILIAIAILSIGMMAVTNMQVSSTSGNSGTIDMTDATNIAEETIYTFLSLNYDDPLLVDPNPVTGTPGYGLEFTPAEPRAAFQLPADIQQIQGEYTVEVNIANDFPIPDTTTYRVIISWNDQGLGGLQRMLTMDYIIYDPTAIL